MIVSRNCWTYVLPFAWTISCIFLIKSASAQVNQELCTDSDFQITSGQGARIEPYERSRVELELGKPLLEKYRNTLKLRFEFKTLSANGTLFYGRSKTNPDEIIALLLRGGHLVYMVQCPSLRLWAREGEPLNDNKWHKINYQVIFGRHGQTGHLDVDGEEYTRRYDVDCKILTSIVMGGHVPNSSDYRYHPEVSDKHGHFEGCIRKVYSSYFLASPPRYYAVSQCD